MKKSFIIFFLFSIIFNIKLNAMKNFEKDTIKTSKGDLIITFVGHGTLMFELNNYIIHIDPVMREADYTKLPKADLILVTHEHFDHLDREAINKIIKDNTLIIVSKSCESAITGMKNIKILKNGEDFKVGEIFVEAIPAYNMVNKRPDGKPFHTKGDGNGYVINIADKRIYIAGDTENIPEMKQLKNIDIAFLPMNLPYTMTPEMVFDAAKAFRPKILYPYHYGNTDTKKLVELMKDEKDIEVRIRKLY